MLYTLNSKLKLSMKHKSAGGFDEVMKMIDDMVVLLGKQQKEDEKQKTWCEDELEKATDEEAATKTKLTETDAKLAELTDTIGTLMEEISGLGASIAALDKSVADATEQRKEEHATYVETMQMNEAAMGLVEKAKNRMQKFYNPTLYKAPPKTEATMEEKIITAGTFAQVHMHIELPPAPDMPTGLVQKSTKSAGDSKALTGKTSTKAEVETMLMTTKEVRSATATDLKQIATVISDLHAACDFIMQNFDLRKEARTSEIEGLKNAKAVLSGASFSF